MEKRYLAFDIGCIECGEGSSVIGIYKSRRSAESACKRREEILNKNWTGQHSCEVFEIENKTVE